MKLVFLSALMLSGAVFAQQDVLLEACNKVPNSAKRLECLKAAMQPRQPSVQQPMVAARPQPLTADSAAAICETVVLSLNAKRALAVEDASLSTSQEFVVTWPADEGKKPLYCNVSRATRKVVALTMNNKVIDGELLADIEGSATQKREMSEGNFKGFVDYAKAGLVQSFKDPASSQYRGLYVSGKVLPVLCGEVNSKNSYGAYVGFRRFFATGKRGLNEVEDTKNPYIINRMWPRMCEEKQADVE